jgi:hypothetical protein
VSGRARPRYDPWRDADGTPIPEGARVEQIAAAKEHGAHPARVHQQGKVLSYGGRGSLRLRVLFDGEDQPVTIRPHLVRVLAR